MDLGDRIQSITGFAGALKGEPHLSRAKDRGSWPISSW